MATVLIWCGRLAQQVTDMRETLHGPEGVIRKVESLERLGDRIDERMKALDERSRRMEDKLDRVLSEGCSFQPRRST